MIEWLPINSQNLLQCKASIKKIEDYVKEHGDKKTKYVNPKRDIKKLNKRIKFLENL